MKNGIFAIKYKQHEKFVRFGYLRRVPNFREISNNLKWWMSVCYLYERRSFLVTEEGTESRDNRLIF